MEDIWDPELGSVSPTLALDQFHLWSPLALQRHPLLSRPSSFSSFSPSPGFHPQAPCFDSVPQIFPQMERTMRSSSNDHLTGRPRVGNPSHL